MVHGIIVLRLGKFERTMLLFCSWVPTYVAAVGKKKHTEKYFVYSKMGFRVQNEDIFSSASKLFYDVNKNFQLFARLFESIS